MKVCDKDCFHCQYPDCINDDMDHEDYVEAAQRDKELRSTPEKRKVAAQKRAYYEANREKVAAQQRAYREANREKVAAQQRTVRETRLAIGLSQVAAARILGVAQTTISMWERGLLRCDADAVAQALRCATQENRLPMLAHRQAACERTHI